uniref:C2 domain-containing protein n=1 Tax=Ananas comosus var. bracteatus TaxID=296719 RepID=A0A6V7PI08_ANACO|nr:unnamed protein product [Ananas comosus var. bracteatus]
MGGDELALEITVLSAESLPDPSSCSFSSSFLHLLFPQQQRLRPYAALSISNSDGDGDDVYRTRVDEEGAHNPTWGDTLLLPVGPAFLDADAAVNLSVLSQGCCRGAGPALLGSCRIPSADVFDGLRPAAARRRLSYALRSTPHHHHHRRPCSVVHVAVRALGRCVDQLAPPPLPPPQLGWARVAVGIPVAAGDRRW